MMKIFGIICIVLSCMIVAYVLYKNSPYTNVRRPFSQYTILTASWENYKKQFINKDGRVIDYSQQDITTSEGQAYAMLRSVWSDDKDTFDLVWKWTKFTMRRPKDTLLGWRWGKSTNGKYGLLAGGGDNSASDADEDIALALIFAANRWHTKSYMDDAQKLLPDIWDKETITINGKRYFMAGNWAMEQKEVVINPSYFAPYAWRIFAKVDTKHDWYSLIAPAYEILQSISTEPLDKTKAVGLVPDWAAITNPAGTIKPASNNGLTTNYSFDAMRTPWRIALDYQWNKDPKAKAYLESYTFLTNIYKNTGKLAAGYTHDGSATTNIENPVMYATAIGFMEVTNKSLAQKMYQEKIITLYSNDQNTFNSTLPYYEQNWLWFGAALYNGYLIPYTE